MMGTYWHVLRAAALIILLSSAVCFAEAQEQTRRVLILNPNTSELPATAIITRAASDRLAAALRGRIEVFTEFLDSSRFPGQVHARRTATFLAAKYSSVR